MLVTCIPLARAALHTAEPVSCQRHLRTVSLIVTNESITTHNKDLLCECFHAYWYEVSRKVHTRFTNTSEISIDVIGCYLKN